MSDGQIRAALGLLRKTLPDLSTTNIDGSVELRSYVLRAPLPVESAAEWLRLHAPSDSRSEAPVINGEVEDGSE